VAITVFGRHYTVPALITNPGAVTNLVLHAAATKPFVVVRCSIEPAQAALVTEAGAVVRMTRKTAAGTYTSIAASTFLNHDPTDSDAAMTAGHTADPGGVHRDSSGDGERVRVEVERGPACGDLRVQHHRRRAGLTDGPSGHLPS
jgi:hypothetical protein